jgi:hypothetical protein
MPKGKSFDTIVADAERLLRVWSDNADLAMGSLTRPAFQTKLDGFKTKRAAVDSLRTQLTAGVNDLNQEASEVVDISNRSRSVARGQYGPDSTQYEQLGGKRASERKKPKRKSAGGTPTS